METSKADIQSNHCPSGSTGQFTAIWCPPPTRADPVGKDKVLM